MSNTNNKGIALVHHAVHVAQRQGTEKMAGVCGHITKALVYEDEKVIISWASQIDKLEIRAKSNDNPVVCCSKPYQAEPNIYRYHGETHYIYDHILSIPL